MKISNYYKNLIFSLIGGIIVGLIAIILEYSKSFVVVFVIQTYTFLFLLLELQDIKYSIKRKKK